MEALVTTSVVLDPRYTWYCHRIPGNCPGLLCYSLWFCVTEVASSSCKWSMWHIGSTQNVHKWCMHVTDTSMGSLLANVALNASFVSCTVCLGSRIFFCIFIVLCHKWYVIERYGWELSTVQRWASTYLPILTKLWGLNFLEGGLNYAEFAKFGLLISGFNFFTTSSWSVMYRS